MSTAENTCAVPHRAAPPSAPRARIGPTAHDTPSRRRMSVSSGLLALACVVAATAEAQDPQTLRVGVYDNQPLVSLDRPDHPTGIFPEIIEEIARREHWRIEWVRASWPECLERLRTGRIDLLGPMAWTPDRDEQYRFSTVPILVNWGWVYTPPDSTIEKIIDLDHKTVAVLRDDVFLTTHDGLRHTTHRYGIHCRFLELDSYEEVARAVADGRADAALFNRLVGERFKRSGNVRRSAILVSPVEIRCAFRPDIPDSLVKRFDDQLGAIKNDPDSAYHRVLDRYLASVEMPALPAWFRNALIGGAALVCVLAISTIVFRRQVRRKTRDLDKANRALRRDIDARRRAEEALRRRDQILAALSRAAEAIISEHEYPEQIDQLLRRLGEAMGVCRAMAVRIEPAEDETPTVAERYDWVAPDIPTNAGCAIEHVLHGEAFGSWFTSLAGAPAEDKTSAARPDRSSGILVLTEQSFTLLALPVVCDDRIWGVIGFAECRHQRAWDTPEIDALRAAANICGAAIMRARIDRDKARLERQLHHAQKMEAIGQLAGGVAHDFNNILTAILGNAELSLGILKPELPADDPLVSGLRQVEQAAQRAARLTRQLLIFSRRDVSHPEILDLNQLILELEKMLRRLITEDIDLEVRGNSDLPPIHADAGQIEQVVMNLVVNARDAMPHGGKLTIETACVTFDDQRPPPAELPAGRFVVLEVRDTGCGMTAETVKHIFEPFFTTKPPGRGTGLGLATVHGIVHRTGGRITVDTAPGRGSRFVVYLPVADTTAPAPSTLPDASTPAGNETILVCEDDDTVRQLVVRILSEAGYRVLAADSGAQALRVAAGDEGPIDLLIADVVMPDMNGTRIAAALSAACPTMRTLYISGYASGVIAERGVLKEGVNFLAKPFDRLGLLRRVREILDRDFDAGDAPVPSPENNVAPRSAGHDSNASGPPPDENPEDPAPEAPTARG